MSTATIVEPWPIEEREGVCGGEPVVTGTRISMEHFQVLVEELGWSVEYICSQYPHVPVDRLMNAIALWMNATRWRAKEGGE